MSPRRSSRARTSQPNPSSQPQLNSSSSSVSSGRAASGARPNQKNPSPGSSVPSRSLSSEEIEGSAKPQSRRTRSSQDDAKVGVIANHVEDDEEEGEEEVTRCICGNLEYPGMPVPASDNTKSGPKSMTMSGLAPSSNILPEDTGGMFIQCDICKVWQHGGCVGIMEEAMSPEEYFCEQCRKDLHKITTSINGQRYSRYLPVQLSPSPHSSTTSPILEDSAKKIREGRSSRTNAEPHTGKRRATMNSRDSAYDEAEQLRRAIEESKKEVKVANSEFGRKGKRSRSDSEQRKGDTKRQRTTSSSPPSDSKTLPPEPASDDDNDNETKPQDGGQNKIRGAAARNHRNKELREQEERREQERAEAAAKRKARSERRRGDDSDPSPEPAPSKNLKPEALASTLATRTPSLPKPSHKKTGRPPTKRGRVGRNQYTRDRDPQLSSLANPDPNTSPAGSNGSNGSNGGTPHINGTHSPSNHAHKPGTNDIGGGTKAKLKHLNPNRTTMNDMKRRVAAILEFISHTQAEMATRNPTRASSTITPPDSGGSVKDGAVGGGGMAQKLLEGQNLLDGLEVDAFKDLSSGEMMEVLTKKLMKWQGEYGKWGDK
ncbi:MAG: hypothetical protein Q9195_004926 [Heterodermia aff. obscurata]